MLESETLKKEFLSKLDKNYSELSKYYNARLKVFSELGDLIYEINTCLMLELNMASITLTNHLLERLLKLALIKNGAGIGPIPVEKWDSTFERTESEYGDKVLFKSITNCKITGLITEDEELFLDKQIRDPFRNGFSHADLRKVLNKLPDIAHFTHGSFGDPKNSKTLVLNPKNIPGLQAFHIDYFAQQNALPYFNYVYELIFKIEERLIAKHKEGTK